IRTRQERADQEARPELAALDAERLGTATPCCEGEHQPRRAEEADADREERWNRLAGQLDPEVRRSPDEVDGPERDPDLRAVTHPPTLPAPAQAGRPERRIPVRGRPHGRSALSRVAVARRGDTARLSRRHRGVLQLARRTGHRPRRRRRAHARRVRRAARLGTPGTGEARAGKDRAEARRAARLPSSRTRSGPRPGCAARTTTRQAATRRAAP